MKFLTAGFLLVVVIFSAGYARGQNGSLTYPQLLIALNAKLPRGFTKAQLIKKLIADVRLRRVDRPLTADRQDDLRQAGATGALIEAIRKNSPALPAAEPAKKYNLPPMSELLKNAPKSPPIQTSANGCKCPLLSVSGPSGLTKPGERVIFTANVSGETADLTYNWSVSAGVIATGQGTSIIVVQTTTDMALTNVTATVEVGGVDRTCDCTTTMSETAGIATLEMTITVDDFTGVKENNWILASVDYLYIKLGDYVNATAYIVNYGSPAEIKKRKAQIEYAIALRRYDRRRVRFVDGPDAGEGIRTKLIVVPSGGTPPTS